MEVISEFRRKIVKNMRRIPTPGQQDQGPPRPTPIKHFQLNVLIDAYEPRDVWRWVFPDGGVLWQDRCCEQQEQEKTG
jgi:hypothetical protein